MKKCLYILVIFLIFISGTLPIYATTKSKPLTKISIILDWYPNPDHAQLYVAQEEGFFKRQGLDVKIIGPADPMDPIKLVAAGKANLGVTYQPELLLAANQGLPIVRVATLIATPLNCLVVRADSNIHSIKDLKGKTIGYSTPGIDDVMVNAMLKYNGMSLKDVKMQNVRMGLTQALITKRVDAITGVMRNYELIELKLAGVPARAFYPEENGMPLYDELVVIANKKELNAPWLPKFILALTQATDYLVNHPEQTWEVFAKDNPSLNNKLNKQAWFATIPRFSLTPGALDKSRYQNYAEFLKQQGVIKTIPKLSSYAVSVKY